MDPSITKLIGTADDPTKASDFLKKLLKVAHTSRDTKVSGSYLVEMVYKAAVSTRARTA
jgi:hypothetical protein